MKKCLLISSFLAVMSVCCFSYAHAQQQYYASAQQPSGNTSSGKASFYRPLKKVMQDLHLQRGIYFMFNDKDIQQTEVDGRIDASANVEQLLSRILTPVGLTYKKVDNIYVIMEDSNQELRENVKKKIEREMNQFASQAQDPLAFKTVTGYGAQVFTVTGKVISDTNEGLPGVNVVLKGTTVGTVTDAEGNYKLDVPDGSGTLVFSFIGFLTEEVAISDRTTVDIQLMPDIRTLSEVVVVGYGTQKRSEVTSAVTSVKSEEFRQSGARNAMDLIQGKVAGLTITRTSGTNPNSSPNIQLRGVTSFTGSTSPLVVVDGIPGGNLDLLQQDDIESIDVLKDGSAAAIYGTQANGGVIIVTTKKGKSGPAKFDYSTYFRREYLQRKPDFMNAAEYRQKVEEGLITPSTNDYGDNVNAVDQLTNKSNLSQYHDLAMSGGTENTTYRASLYYQDIQGIAKENSRQQYGTRISITQKGMNDRLTGQFNLANNFNEANLLGGGGWEWAYSRNPTRSLHNADGTWFNEGTATNEVARLEQQKYRRQQQTTSADMKFTLEVIPGLKGSFFGSVQRNSWLDNAYYDRASEASVDSYKGSGYAYKNSELGFKYAVEPTIEYSHMIDDHNITAIAGYSYRYEVNEGFNGSNYGFVNDIFEDNNLGAGTQLALGKATLSSYKNDNTLIAFFGRVNYAFQNKYMFQAILRHEGSSRFGENNKWGNFPAVSAGWNISKEDFMQSFGFLDDMKIRVGYGVTGNSGIANYSSLVTLSTGGNYLYPDGVWRQTYGPTRNPNPDLRWEKKKEFNVGIDFAFLSRFTGAIEFYTRRTEDLLENYTSQLPPFVRETIYANVGTISAKGLELTIGAAVMNKSDFKWNVDFVGSTASNKLVSFSNDTYKTTVKTYGGIGGFGALGDAIRTYEGQKLGNFVGKRYAGLTEDGKWLFYNRNNEKVSFDKINNTTDRTQSDLAVIGNAIPKYYLGITNLFGYKNFDLRVYFRGRFGYDILNTMEISYGNKVSAPLNLLKSAYGKNKAINDTYQYSDYYIEKGGFLKLDEVSLGYKVNVTSSYIRNLRVYVTGSNLAIFTKYKGNDPDFVGDTGLGPGIDSRGPYPSTKSFLVGLQAGF